MRSAVSSDAADIPEGGSAATRENSAAVQEFWADLRKTTQARIGLGRAGNALPTREVLELAAAHAAARDAVHIPLDTDALAAAVRAVGIGEPMVVTSRATTREEYLRRPDLGRMPAADTDVPHAPADIGVVLADGLANCSKPDDDFGMHRFGNTVSPLPAWRKRCRMARRPASRLT